MSLPIWLLAAAACLAVWVLRSQRRFAGTLHVRGISASHFLREDLPRTTGLPSPEIISDGRGVGELGSASIGVVDDTSSTQKEKNAPQKSRLAEEAMLARLVGLDDGETTKKISTCGYTHRDREGLPVRGSFFSEGLVERECVEKQNVGVRFAEFEDRSYLFTADQTEVLGGIAWRENVSMAWLQEARSAREQVLDESSSVGKRKRSREKFSVGGEDTSSSEKTAARDFREVQPAAISGELRAKIPPALWGPSVENWYQAFDKDTFETFRYFLSVRGKVPAVLNTNAAAAERRRILLSAICAGRTRREGRAVDEGDNINSGTTEISPCVDAVVGDEEEEEVGHEKKRRLKEMRVSSPRRSSDSRQKYHAPRATTRPDLIRKYYVNRATNRPVSVKEGVYHEFFFGRPCVNVTVDDTRFNHTRRGGPVVLDIGGWVGLQALWLGQVAASMGGSVVTVEHSPEAVHSLETHLRRNEKSLVLGGPGNFFPKKVVCVPQSQAKQIGANKWEFVPPENAANNMETLWRRCYDRDTRSSYWCRRPGAYSSGRVKIVKASLGTSTTSSTTSRTEDGSSTSSETVWVTDRGDGHDRLLTSAAEKLISKWEHEATLNQTTQRTPMNNSTKNSSSTDSTAVMNVSTTSRETPINHRSTRKKTVIPCSFPLGCAPSAKVPLVGVRDLEKAHPELQRCSLVNIDVAGGEVSVLSNLEEWLSERKPVLVLRFHPETVDHHGFSVYEEVFAPSSKKNYDHETLMGRLNDYNKLYRDFRSTRPHVEDGGFFANPRRPGPGVPRGPEVRNKKYRGSFVDWLEPGAALGPDASGPEERLNAMDQAQKKVLRVFPYVYQQRFRSVAGKENKACFTSEIVTTTPSSSGLLLGESSSSSAPDDEKKMKIGIVKKNIKNTKISSKTKEKESRERAAKWLRENTRPNGGTQLTVPKDISLPYGNVNSGRVNLWGRSSGDRDSGPAVARPGRSRRRRLKLEEKRRLLGRSLRALENPESSVYLASARKFSAWQHQTTREKNSSAAVAIEEGTSSSLSEEDNSSAERQLNEASFSERRYLKWDPERQLKQGFWAGPGGRENCPGSVLVATWEPLDL